MTFKLALLDLGGVVYLGERPLPGSVDAIERLRSAGITVRFLTNSTRSSHRMILARLQTMGLAVKADELFTPARAACALLAQKGWSPHLLIHPALAEDFSEVPEGDARAVVVGDAGENFTYAALNAAFRELDKGAAFLALANNRSFRDIDGGLSLDAGPFVAALAYASRREPVVLGKPSPDFFAAALASAGTAAQDALMVGDDVENDVGGAIAAGIAGVLVRTGKYQPGDERRVDPPPSAVADDLAAAVDWALAGGTG